MRTKTLLLTAALGAAGLTSALAQDTVFSSNAVGFVNTTVPGTGFSPIANPLDAGDNTIANLFNADTAPDMLPGVLFEKWNGAGFDIETYVGTGWIGVNGDAATLAPGEGGFFFADTEFQVTFVGEVEQGPLSNPIPGNSFSMKSSQVPQSGTASELDLTNDLASGDALYKWNGSAYDIYTLIDPGSDLWQGPNALGEEPEINIAEAVFIFAGADTSWDRTFSVNTQ